MTDVVQKIDSHLRPVRRCVPGVDAVFVFAAASVSFAILSFFTPPPSLSPSYLNLDPSSCFNFTAGSSLALDPFRAASSRHQIERWKEVEREGTSSCRCDEHRSSERGMGVRKTTYVPPPNSRERGRHPEVPSVPIVELPLSKRGRLAAKAAE